jgi:2-deoxy-D-gluconate 3-dehydrogenase
MIMDLFRLDGKCALVTGASRGIGRAIALALAEAGADVAVASRDAGALSEVAGEIESLRRASAIVAVDLAIPDDARRAVREAAASLGGLDILVNNAGVNRRGLPEELSDQDWDEVMAVNARAPFITGQEAAAHMRQRGGGKVINVSSLTTVIGVPFAAAYCASKGALTQLTRAMAQAYAGDNIQVNALGPGYIRTQFTRPLDQQPAFMERILNRTAARRWGHPEDLQGAAVFLASSASDFVTGTVLWVDGGFLSG